jgi:hypothetical protein
MVNKEFAYIVPRKREAVRWMHPYEFSPEEVGLIKYLVRIGHQHLWENRESCPWPEKAEDILKEIERLTTCVPFKVLLTYEEYEALYALLSLALQLTMNASNRPLDLLLDSDDEEKGKISRLIRKIIENMERLRNQETFSLPN